MSIFVLSEKITVADDIEVRRAGVRTRSNSRAGHLFIKKRIEIIFVGGEFLPYISHKLK